MMGYRFPFHVAMSATISKSGCLVGLKSTLDHTVEPNQHEAYGEWTPRRSCVHRRPPGSAFQPMLRRASARLSCDDYTDFRAPRLNSGPIRSVRVRFQNSTCSLPPEPTAAAALEHPADCRLPTMQVAKTISGLGSLRAAPAIVPPRVVLSSAPRAFTKRRCSECPTEPRSLN